MSTKTVTAAAIVGAALVGSLTAVNVASAADNPFAAKSLSSGYMQLAETEGKEMKEGKCGEGKETTEGESKEMKEGKCGEGKETTEAKSGEGKCGGSK